MIRTGRISLQTVGTVTSVAEKAGNALSADDNRACSNGGSRENGCSDGRGYLKKLLCYKGG